MQPPIASHIMSVAQTLSGGGVERALLRMAGLWVERGRRVTLLIGDAAGPLASELPPGVERVVLGRGSYAALARATAPAVRAVRPDVLFIPGNHYTGVAALTRLRLGRRAPPMMAKVSNALVRGDMGWRGAGYRRWLRLHPRFLDALVAMTPGMAAEAVAQTGMSAARVAVIPNPPALPVPGAVPVALPPGRYVLGVGRLAPQKRWERAVEAFARVAPADTTLLILGEGPERPMLERRIAALGLGGRVWMPGHAADPLPAIAGAAVLLLTSDYEGVPGVLRESVALGTPVVATESSVAVREIVTALEQGSIVAPDDAAALDAALAHWLRPGAVRPAPRVEAGDPAGAYLALFDQLASGASGS